MPRVEFKKCSVENNRITITKGKKTNIKEEVGDSVEQVIHRKSERRRIARDIFLVFEEQRSVRCARGSSKQKFPKSKFGHLKVEDLTKRKGVLRGIKNESKCYLSHTGPRRNRKQTKVITKHSKSGCDRPTGHVDPIFLWVKQDDTKIVEVRCEDYDKRNRIRITKTTNGWRVIPHTDPSTSRIVKILQKPLRKVKREMHLKSSQTQAVESPVRLKIPLKTHVIQTLCSSPTHLEPFEAPSTSTIEPPVHESSVYEDSSKNSKRLYDEENNACSQSDNVTYSDLKVDAFEQINKNQSEGISDSAENDVIKFDEEPCENQAQELQLCPKTGLFVPNTGGEIVASDKDNLEVEDGTKNLNDLLDEADLMQSCCESANSDADLIDSIVNEGCTHNLLEEAELLKDLITESDFTLSHHDSLVSKKLALDGAGSTNETVREPPKCLSFNEAGEIEGLNDDLFHTNSYIEALSKEPIEEIQLNLVEAAPINVSLNTLLNTNQNFIDNITEEIPKDLSFKKREEICPPLESRSQCAVTSSSDVVVDSPTQNDMPVIDSASEKIKNMILEQIIKLNAINAITAATVKKPLEPINLGKHTESTNLNHSIECSATLICADSGLIRSSESEPVKKRLCNATKDNSDLDESISTIDKDPDPLTQLRLLIKNSQWKVPDPILVPKDRLSAVIASPAREIPLLITTRPELRLPEAFAYPEIIQNPNILVISLAQLQTILKNEMEMEKIKLQKHKTKCTSDNKIDMLKPYVVSDSEQIKRTHPAREMNKKCSHVDLTLSSEINTASLALINQMLWLPYFGPLSQEFLKSFKEPLENNYSNLLPLLNQQFSLQHLDELYKNYTKQISNATTSVYDYNCATGVGPLQNPVDLAIFQRIIQHQMHNFLSINLPPNSVQKELAEKSASNEQSSNVSINNYLEQINKGKSFVGSSSPSNFILEDKRSIALTENALRSKSVRAICDNLNAPDLSKFEETKKAVADNKPRLTCKSLSNLLEPDVKATVTASTAKNFKADQIKSAGEACKQINNQRISKETRCLQISDANLKSIKPAKVDQILGSLEISKQRKRHFNIADSGRTEATVRNPDALNTDFNPTLWHPLYGSNTKSGYSSPWQWTTVTATAE